MGDKSSTPNWLKRKARARQAETGEKYMAALRAVSKEAEERKDGVTPPSEGSG